MNGIQFAFIIGMNTKSGNPIKSGVMRLFPFAMTAPMNINKK